MIAIELEFKSFLEKVASRLEVIELMKSQAEMTANISRLLCLVEKKLKEFV